MSDFPLQRILDFIRTLTPFDTLGQRELEEVISHLQIEFFAKDEIILKPGGPSSQYLYIIQAGSALINIPASEDEEEILVDIRGEGDFFGSVSLLQGSQALFQVTAREDLICFLLPAQPFKELVKIHPAFERHFSFSLARNLQAIRRGVSCEMPRLTGLEGVSLDAALVRSQVREMMSNRVLTCLAATPVAAAAKLMALRQVGSIVVEEEGSHPIGIVTDRDLRVRVLAEGRNHQDSVAAIMSYPLHTISPDSYAFEALLEMSRHGVSHLVVTSHDRVVGVISDHDLQTLTGASPLGVIRDISKVNTVDGMVRLHERIDRVLETLLRQGGSAQTMLDLVTEFNDRLTRKLLEIIEEEIDNQGGGRAPVPFCWIALGSEGRREQTLRTDQDNALLFANVPADREKRIKTWFLGFAEKVVDALERCGFPRCQGGIMASNPYWCQSERDWQNTFKTWVMDPNPETLRNATIFFDFRSIYTEADFTEALARRLGEAMENHRLFLRHMAKNALYNRPPLGFLRQFVVDKSGEHKNKLNLKLSGLTPLVEAVRVMSLDLGLTCTNSLKRLEGIAQGGLVQEGLSADLREAFSFITLLRISHHLEARARGQVPDNFINPEDLNKFQRKMLKESFAVISKLQDLLEHRYQTSLVG